MEGGLYNGRGAGHTSKTSASLKPLMTTTFNFTDFKPEDERATSRDRRTASCPFLLVINSNLNGSKVSRLMNHIVLVNRSKDKITSDLNE